MYARECLQDINKNIRVDLTSLQDQLDEYRKQLRLFEKQNIKYFETV